MFLPAVKKWVRGAKYRWSNINVTLQYLCIYTNIYRTRTHSFDHNYPASSSWPDQDSSAEWLAYSLSIYDHPSNYYSSQRALENRSLDQDIATLQLSPCGSEKAMVSFLLVSWHLERCNKISRLMRRWSAFVSIANQSLSRVGLPGSSRTRVHFRFSYSNIDCEYLSMLVVLTALAIRHVWVWKVDQMPPNGNGCSLYIECWCLRCSPSRPRGPRKLWLVLQTSQPLVLCDGVFRNLRVCNT